MEPNQEDQPGASVDTEIEPTGVDAPEQTAFVRLIAPWTLGSFTSPAHPGVHITQEGTAVKLSDLEAVQSEADRLGIRISIEREDESE